MSLLPIFVKFEKYRNCEAGYELWIQYEPEPVPLGGLQSTKLEVHGTFRGSKHTVSS